MLYIDTHTHLYDERFDADRPETIRRAVERGVRRMFLPAIDSESHDRLIDLARSWPGTCLAMIGFHPTSVNDNPEWRSELECAARLLEESPVPFYGIGEMGLDLYWSRDYRKEQEEALRFQIELALRYDLPIVLHTREAFTEIIRVIAEYKHRGLRGIFHSFAGTAEQYRILRGLGDFRFGIGGVVTYKKAPIAAVLEQMELTDLVLETDAPYLPPVSFRGQRNESAFLPLIAEKIAGIKGVPLEEVARITTRTAEHLFGLL
ncbi:MAG: TatD family hydrolase [Rikenellaceae bacterium]|nr:TatD family hydrolase [Rikenellaceae bacterium]